MENLISKWKQTVEMHSRKLSQLKEHSLGASTSSRVAMRNSIKGSSASQQPQKTDRNN